MGETRDPIMVDITKPCDGYCSGPDVTSERLSDGSVVCFHCKRRLCLGKPWDKYTKEADPTPMPAPVRELVEAAEKLVVDATEWERVSSGEGQGPEDHSIAPTTAAIAAVRTFYGEKP